VWSSQRGLTPPRLYEAAKLSKGGMKRQIGARGGNVVSPKLPTPFWLVRAISELGDEALQAKRLRRTKILKGSWGEYRMRRRLFVVDLGFFGLARGGETARVRLRHVTASPSGHAVILLPDSKGDAYSVGHTMVVARVTRSGIPAGRRILETAQWMRDAGCDGDTLMFIKTLPERGWETPFAPPPASELPATTENVRNDFRNTLEVVRKDIGNKAKTGALVAKAEKAFMLIAASQYSAHSLRRGGRTHLSQLGVPDAVVGAHGRWLSEVHLAYDHWSYEDRAACSRLM